MVIGPRFSTKRRDLIVWSTRRRRGQGAIEIHIGWSICDAGAGQIRGQSGWPRRHWGEDEDGALEVWKLVEMRKRTATLIRGKCSCMGESGLPGYSKDEANVGFSTPSKRRSSCCRKYSSAIEMAGCGREAVTESTDLLQD